MRAACSLWKTRLSSSGPGSLLADCELHARKRSGGANPHPFLREDAQCPGEGGMVRLCERTIARRVENPLGFREISFGTCEIMAALLGCRLRGGKDGSEPLA